MKVPGTTNHNSKMKIINLLQKDPFPILANQHRYANKRERLHHLSSVKAPRIFFHKSLNARAFLKKGISMYLQLHGVHKHIVCLNSSLAMNKV